MKNLDITQEVAKAITEVAVRHEIKGDVRQFNIQVQPIISNAIYNRSREIRQEERLRAIIRLSKTSVSEDEALELIAALDYKLVI